VSVAAATLLLGAVSAAQTGARPVISGEPIVGHVLTSSPGPTGQALYKWQGCDPAIADCSDSPNHNDPDWTDLTGESHTGQSYTIPSSDLGHFIRVLIHDNNLGDQWSTSAPVGPVRLGFGPPPTPDHGLTVLAEPKGPVKIKPPGQKGFTPFNEFAELPVDTVFDTRGGKVKITAAVGNFGETTPDNSVDFYGGIFMIKQSPEVDAPAVAKLVEKLRCPKTKGGTAKASSSSEGPVAQSARKRRRRVWGSGSGSYGTAGRGGTGSVVGTTWLTQDTCKGTLFRVTEGIGIKIFDFGLKKEITLGPGQKYFARNR
jgi:hypothetical protein